MAMGTVAPLADSSLTFTRTSRKRSLDGPENGQLSDGDPDHDDSCSDIDVSSVLNGMGYMSHHHHLVLGQGHGPKVK
jgi:hypothetical protein